MPVFTNLSAAAREYDIKGRTFFGSVGDRIAAGIWKEFVQLVEETAQYTGTTAASWNLSLGGDPSPPREQTLAKGESPLAKGHQAAVDVALSHNAGALDGLSSMGLPGQKGNTYKAIVVENTAPGADRAEDGPLRSVNTPAGAFARFQERVRHRVWSDVYEEE